MNESPPRKKLQRLLSFPFTPVETDMFVEHLKAAERDNEFARDILLMWNIQTARFSDARDIISMDGQADGQRRVIKEGLEKANVI
jgi:hypothetical protein